MSRDVYLLLIGAGIGLLASIVGIVVQHFLSLRADKVTRERDRREEEKSKLREQITGKEHLGQGALKAIKDLTAVNRYLESGEPYYGPERYYATIDTEADIQARIDETLRPLARNVHTEEIVGAHLLLNRLMDMRTRRAEEGERNRSSVERRQTPLATPERLPVVEDVRPQEDAEQDDHSERWS
jgi:hypothetical protein